MGRGGHQCGVTASPPLNLETPAPWSITYSGADFALRSSIAGAAGETLRRGEAKLGGLQRVVPGQGGDTGHPIPPGHSGEGCWGGDGAHLGGTGGCGPPPKSSFGDPKCFPAKPRVF